MKIDKYSKMSKKINNYNKGPANFSQCIFFMDLTKLNTSLQNLYNFQTGFT